MTTEEIFLILNAPPKIIQDLSQIYEKKYDLIKNMKFEEAMNLRDEEKKLLTTIGLPISFKSQDLLNVIRDYKIDQIIK